MSRSSTQIVALQAQAQRTALAMVTGTAVFAMVLVVAFVGERQQPRQDVLTQEMRGPLLVQALP